MYLLFRFSVSTYTRYELSIYLHNHIRISFADQPLLLNVESFVDRDNGPASRPAVTSHTGLMFSILDI